MIANDDYISSTNKYYVINPSAGHGISDKSLAFQDESINLHFTKSGEECREYVKSVCENDPYAWIIICGGDGTISDSISGILDAGCGKTAAFSVIPTGSGNDFCRQMNVACEDNRIYDIDVVKVGEHYSVNMLNVGFDCSVVSEAIKFRKPYISGSFAYILGVLKVLIKKESFNVTVHLSGVDGTDKDEVVNDDFLLTAIANCPYCGGGFKALPFASCSDGLIDVLLIKNLTRRRFIRFVGDYKAGTHFVSNGEITPKLKDILIFRRCKSISFSGIKQICVDGEIIDTDTLNAEIVPGALRYIKPSNELMDLFKKK